jgi:hypothetical protein
MIGIDGTNLAHAAIAAALALMAVAIWLRMGTSEVRTSRRKRRKGGPSFTLERRTWWHWWLGFPLVLFGVLWAVLVVANSLTA